jgi:small subunit ribosomal protein S5
MERKPRKFNHGGERAPREFDQKVVEVTRVTRVTSGGKRMRFRALVVVGDRKGRIGMGLRKGADVADSVNKAVATAKKHMITLPLAGETVPHEIKIKFKSARLLIKPARTGSGIIAGGAVRGCMELAGVKNVVTKSHGSSNKVNVIKAVFAAFDSMKSHAELKARLKKPEVKSEVKPEVKSEVKPEVEEVK